MNILHVIESLEFGGAEKVVVHLANRLAEHHRVTVCLTKFRGELVAELSDRIELIQLDLGEGRHFNLPALLAGIIRQHNIDVVNIHNWAIFIESWLAVRKARSAGLVMTVHGPYTDYGPGIVEGSKKRLRHLGERIAAHSKWVKKIITVSDSIQHYIRSDIGIPPAKLVTLHNGIKPLNIDKHGGSATVLGLITVGRLAAIKNHRMMLNALRLVVDDGTEVRLTLVGDGPERPALEQCVRDLELTRYVDFLGFRSDIDELLATQDVFVLSSDYEGVSIALLEAMSLAIPAIATDVGGIPETIIDGYSGYIVEKGNARALADSIIKLAQSKTTRHEFGENALRHFNANFHEDIVIDKYDKLYHACLTS